MTDKCLPVSQAKELAYNLATTFCKSGYELLQESPDCKTGTATSTSYIQILKADFKKSKIPSLSAYMVIIVPKVSHFNENVKVTFLSHAEENARVSVRTKNCTIYLGENPPFRAILEQIITSLSAISYK